MKKTILCLLISASAVIFADKDSDMIAKVLSGYSKNKQAQTETIKIAKPPCSISEVGGMYVGSCKDGKGRPIKAITVIDNTVNDENKLLSDEVRKEWNKGDGEVTIAVCVGRKVVDENVIAPYKTPEIYRDFTYSSDGRLLRISKPYHLIVCVKEKKLGE